MRTGFALAMGISALAFGAAQAKEYPIGKPQSQAGMEVGAVYLQPIEMGPAGMIRLGRGVIRHERHVHMGPTDAAHYGVKDGDRLHLRVKGDCGAVLEGLLVRLAPASKLEVHIDTDEGNAVHLARATGCELFK